MRKTVIKSLMVTTLGVAALLLLGQNDASAKITGACDSCHTMHNSQDGTNMANTSVAQDNLLLSATCLGCHTDENGDEVQDDTNGPGVDTSNGNPGSNYLAGGSFWYNAAGYGDRFVHNVDEIGSADSHNSNDPPGGASLNSTFSCASGASTTGCHLGTGQHHTNTGGDYSSSTNEVIYVDGAASGQHFRFLSGIKGGEDSDWEWTTTATDHNVYTAVEDYDTTATDSMTALCVRCHGDFHGSNPLSTAGGGISTDGTNPFVRHPTDLSLFANTGPNSTEHQSYGTYTASVPIAATTAHLDGAYNNGETLTMANYDALDNTNLDMVTCVSCHRAHGTENPDLLRWSYNTALMEAGSGGSVGCLKCHTGKK